MCHRLPAERSGVVLDERAEREVDEAADGGERSCGCAAPDEECANSRADLDYRLIATLRHDSRTPVTALARELGVNRSTVTTRIERLVDAGVIEGFTIRLSSDIDCDAIRAITMVLTEPNRGHEIVREINGYPEIERFHSRFRPCADWF